MAASFRFVKYYEIYIVKYSHFPRSIGFTSLLCISGSPTVALTRDFGIAASRSLWVAGPSGAFMLDGAWTEMSLGV